MNKITDSERSRLYRLGFEDGFADLPPAWLGLDWYKIGYEGGQRAAEHPRGFVLLGESTDGRERLYLVNGAEVYVSHRDREWRASVPGRGGTAELHAANAVHSIPSRDRERAGRWFTEGRGDRTFMAMQRIVLSSQAA